MSIYKSSLKNGKIVFVPITFSDHAKFQLKKRNITQALARKAIKDPHTIISSFQGRKLRQRRIGGKILEVVTKTEGPRITVVTGYYLEEDYENEI